MTQNASSFIRRLLWLTVVANIAILVPAGTTAATTQPTSTKSNQRCTKVDAERTVKGQKQRCTRNARGVMRWQTTTTSESSSDAKVIQVTSSYYGGTDVGPIAYMQDASLLAGGTFWFEATLGDISVERESLGPDSSFPWGANDTGFIATISSNLEWTSARQFGGTGAQSAGFDVMVPLRDNSAFVAGRFRGRLNIDGTTYRAERNDAEDTWTTKNQWGYSQTAYFGRIRADGTWVWHRAWPTAGGSWITSAHELADGSLLLTGGYNLTPNHAPKTGYASSDKHVVLLYSRDGQLLSSRLIGLSPNIEGSWIDFKVSSILQDGSAIITGFYCGALSFGNKSLPVSGAPRVNSKGSITPYCDPQAYWMIRPSGFVAKMRPDLTVEWLVDLKPLSSKPLDSQIRVHGSAVSQTGEIVIIGELMGGEYRFGKTSLKARSAAAPGSIPERIGFVAGIDTQGEWLWATQAGTYIRTIRSTPDNKFVIAGLYERPGITLGAYKLTTASEGDGFVAKLDGFGRWEWLNGISFPGPRTKEFNSSILDMAVAPDGSVAIAGFTYANVQFGSTPVTGPGGTATGFIARLAPNGRWK